MNHNSPQSIVKDGSPSPGEVFTCGICGSSAEHPVYHAREFQNGMGEVFRYFACAKCGCLQHVKVPEDLGKYYPAHYYSHQAGGPRSLGTRLRAALESRRDRFLLHGRGLVGRFYQVVSPASALAKLRHAGIHPGSRILDVGSGTAPHLHFLAEEGFRHVTGADPFVHETLTYPNGLRVLKQDIRDLEGEWDVILFNHSLEHMPDHPGTLIQARKLLAEGGTCIVEIPTVSSWAWRHYGIYWHQLDAPRHLYLHSLESFRLLAEKTGFTIVEIQFTGVTSQFWGSENYRKGVKPKVSRTLLERISVLAYRALTCVPQALRARHFNRTQQGDQVAFYLKKQEASRA